MLALSLIHISTFPWMEPKPGSMGVPNPQYDVDLLRPDGTRAEDGEQGQMCIRDSLKTAQMEV